MEITHEGKRYKVVEDEPKNGDLVLTNNYGVWDFKDEGNGTAPMPYWANKKTCKKMVECNNSPK